ncbi:hypothetical protein [Brevirhabdus sp.]|uniref:hypothetical protein n=1 Tax=Brevirhabdus sp. TaxID=2004514 RepID=UPI004057CF25
MEKLALGAILVLLGYGIARLQAALWRSTPARRDGRAAYLDDCAALFHAPRRALAPSGFPRLSGRYGGQVFDVQVVPDTLTFRKLPALWVLVTLPRPLPLRGTLDLMIRPMGVEPFSNFDRLPDQIAPPPGFPEDCTIRTDDRAALPPQAPLRDHLALFDDPRMKEMIVSPKGVRLVFLAEEAARTRYLIFRDCEMGAAPLPADRLRPVLDRVLALHADMDAASRPQSLSA